MNQQEFLINVFDYSKSEGFSFLATDGEFEDPKRLSGAKQALVAAVAGAAFGLLGSLSSGYMKETDKACLIGDLKRMMELCDAVGIKLSDGNVLIRLVINADNVADETLVGRFAVVHERAYDFRKYAMSLMRSIWNDGKLPTVAQVIVAFSTHRRAKVFSENFADKCKHTAIWKKVYTQPWIVDLEDEDIQRLRQPLSDLVSRGSDKIKAGFFRKR